MTKRLLAFVIAVAVMCSLSGCMVIIYDLYYEIAQDTDRIVTIALYENNGDNELSEQPVAQISPEDHEAFVAALEKLPFVNGSIIILAAVDPSFYFGAYVIRIDYSNGDYELISNCGYQEIHYADGTCRTRRYSIRRGWDDFLLTQFGVE